MATDQPKKVIIIINGDAKKPVVESTQAQQSAQTDGQRKRGDGDEGGIYDVGTGFKE